MMRKLIPLRLRQLARPMVRRFRQPKRQVPSHSQLQNEIWPKPSYIPPNVARALEFPVARLPNLKVSSDVNLIVEGLQQVVGAPSSREIFSLDGARLPCWLETDVTFLDDWLTSPSYYPVYFSLFEKLTSCEGPTRLLEIGVRTGYIGVVFAKAARGSAFYLGVDPNLYVENGLELASATLKKLRRPGKFDFLLFEGYSWDNHVQNSLVYSGPYNLIHIDGDHTLVGKLIDLDLSRQVLAPNGLVLLDDYDHHPIVPEAIKRAFALGWFRDFAYVPSKRGLAILRP